MTKLNICIRGISESVIQSLEHAAAKRKLSREEYLRQCLNRIAYDDRALENRYVQQLQKLAQCMKSQQEQLTEIKEMIIELEDAVVNQTTETI